MELTMDPVAKIVDELIKRGDIWQAQKFVMCVYQPMMPPLQWLTILKPNLNSHNTTSVPQPEPQPEPQPQEQLPPLLLPAPPPPIEINPVLPHKVGKDNTEYVAHYFVPMAICNTIEVVHECQQILIKQFQKKTMHVTIKGSHDELVQNATSLQTSLRRLCKYSNITYSQLAIDALNAINFQRDIKSWFIVERDKDIISPLHQQQIDELNACLDVDVLVEKRIIDPTSCHPAIKFSTKSENLVHGVFATCDIGSDTIISVYNRCGYVTMDTEHNLFDPSFETMQAMRTSLKLFRIYKKNTNIKTESLRLAYVGFRNPENKTPTLNIDPHVGGSVAPFVNDARPAQRCKKRKQGCTCESYLDRSPNCEMRAIFHVTPDDHPQVYIVFMTTKDIKHNDEILLDYGSEYWNHIQNTARERKQHLQKLT